MSVSGSTKRPTFLALIGYGLLTVWLSCCCANRLAAQGYSTQGRPSLTPQNAGGVTNANGQFVEQFGADLDYLSKNSEARGAVSGEPSQSLEDDRIRISSDFAQTWDENGKTVYLLRGHCVVEQGDAKFKSEQMVVWQKVSNSIGEERAGAPIREELELFLEDDVRYDRDGRTVTDQQLFLKLVSSTDSQFQFRHEPNQTSANHDEFFQRAEARRSRPELPPGVEQTQYVVRDPQREDPEIRLVQLQSTENLSRRVRIFRRSNQGFNVTWERSDKTTPPEQIATINGGIQILIDGLSIADTPLNGDTIDLSADKVVIWTEVIGEGFQTEMFQSSDSQLQFYLEGNIIIRQGNQTIRAERAFYDVRAEKALILNAELRSYVPSLRSDIRVRAARIRQLSPNYFHAQNAWSSTSQYGKPGYRFQASDIYLENRPNSSWTGPQPMTFDPQTGQPVANETLWVTSMNNTLIVEDIPLFYSPIVSGPAEDPQIPIRSISLGQDNIFGFQAEVTWDVQQIFGLQLPDAFDWDIRTDYFTDRGPRLGTDFGYQGYGLFGADPSARGNFNIDFMHDDGVDNLGLDRRNVPLENSLRGLAHLQHEQILPGEVLLRGELGYIPDRNYLEQYYEKEFDTLKDYETLIYLQQNIDNWSWSLLTRPELNDFEASTEWLPKADLYALSEPLFNSLLTYSSHSSVGYGMIQPGVPSPFPAQDIWSPLPYLAPVDGLVAMTRQQLDAPFNIGPVNFVPFVMGEAAYWGEDLTGNDLDRLVGQAGARAHMMMWKMYPYVQSDIFNLRGLMHKVDFDAEYTYTDSTQDFNNIPQYNEFEENSQERFRRRLLTNTFGGALPMIPGYGVSPYDPRFYLIRSGAGSSVTSPYHELIEDQQALRFSVRQRLQTKMGPPERTRIEDWMILEAGAAYFPRSDRDNFGEDFGLIYGNYEWQIGARTKVLASALYDTFDQGQETWSVGLLSQRSLRGSAYLGFRQVAGGPLESQILTASYSYVMSPKWISTFGTAYDIAENQNRGQSLTVTRVGEYALLHFGTSFDASKGNASFTISLEPKFGPFNAESTQLSSLLQSRK